MATFERASRAAFAAGKAGILTQQHQHVAVMLGRLEAATVEGGDPASIGRTWDLLKQEIESHLSAEESDLIPRFGSVQPQAAEAILVEHAAIRAKVSALTIQVGLGSLTAEHLGSLARLLARHSERERGGLYPWAESRLMGWVWEKVRRATAPVAARRPA